MSIRRPPEPHNRYNAGMDAERVKEVLDRLGEPSYRLKQILRAVYKQGVGTYAEITSLPASLRAALEKEAPMMSLKPENILSSEDKRAHKAVLSLADGLSVESVLLRPKPGGPWSCCISCQVGCAVGCSFCATGSMGLVRSLEPEEIADQALFWRQFIRTRKLDGSLLNVVYMGMGEPFHNLDASLASLRILLDPEGLGFAARRISMSTVGIVPAMEIFASGFSQVNLALSLHAANDELRSRLVPVNNAFPLAALSGVLDRVIKTTNRKVFLEYVVLAGENDRAVHARELARFVRSVSRPELLHVNLIAYNPGGSAGTRKRRGKSRPSSPHKRPTEGAMRGFRDKLQTRGVSVTIRRSLGTDIQGACGQLVVQCKKSPK